MRLLTCLNQDEFTLTRPFIGNKIPPYAILSHTWLADEEEVTFADLNHGRGKEKLGYEKLSFCCKQAQRDNIKYFWVDTCCIDKSSSAELSEAITSMYRWYQNAQKCYVYLPDVLANSTGDNSQVGKTWETEFRKSRWFERGWTLQELLAPKTVEFYSREGTFLGTREELAECINEITGLPLDVLYGSSPSQYSVAERLRWINKRKTTREEDRAYSMLGIFDVSMVPNYGEGSHAFRRLLEMINDRSARHTYVPVSNGYMAEPLEPRLPATSKRHFDAISDFTEQASKRSRLQPNTTESSQAYNRSISRSQDNFSSNYESLLKSLWFDRITFRVDNVRNALLSTCNWLLCHPDFKVWFEDKNVDRHNGFFWIKGKPGCGKSTLMKTAFEWARKKLRSRARQTIVPYFFHARASGVLEKSVLGLYRTIVHHLLSKHDYLRDLFMEKFASKDTGSSGIGWTAEELQNFLSDCVELPEALELCLFIDALDEAEYENDVRQMISFLIELSDRAVAAGGHCKLRICLSSRHYPHISISRGISLVVEEQPEHGHDIDTYIQKQLTCRDGEEKDILRTNLVQKSAHVFLWVVLVVEILNKMNDRGSSLRNMQARLELIPAGLNELFRDILLHCKHGIETTVLFFQWTIHSMRSFELRELFIAIEYSRSPTDPKWQPELTVPPLDRLALYILDCSLGLAEVVEMTPGKPAVVQFIHETVREFLIKDNGLVTIVPALASNLNGISHEILRIACLRCIVATPIPDDYQRYYKDSHRNKDLLEEFKSSMRLRLPFLDYAILHLFDHAEQAQVNHISQQDFVKTQVNKDGEWLGPHHFWWNVLERFGSKKIKSNTTLLYFLLTTKRTWPNLTLVLSSLSDVKNLLAEHKNLLELAVAHDDHDKVRLLLEVGVDVNADQGNALRIASKNGQKEVVQILLDAGADVNAQGGEYGNSLQVASVRGRKEVVELLLEAGADVNTQGGEHGNALQAASYRGSKEVVKLLLEAGADVDTQGGRYGNVLQAALCLGRKEVVKLLLEAGADVNAQGGHYSNALQAASVRGHKEAVEILLEAGADVNTQGGGYGNALQAASYRGSKEVVELLLEAGADINTQGGEHGNALQVASIRDNKEVVELLLEAGADVNAQGGGYGNALQAASYRGSKEVVELLLEAGADVNAQGGHYGNALQAASSHGHKEIVQLLLEAGAMCV